MRGVRKAPWRPARCVASRAWRRPEWVASGKTAWRPGRGVRKAAWRPGHGVRKAAWRLTTRVASANARGIHSVASGKVRSVQRSAWRPPQRGVRHGAWRPPHTLADATRPLPDATVLSGRHALDGSHFAGCHAPCWTPRPGCHALLQDATHPKARGFRGVACAEGTEARSFIARGLRQFDFLGDRVPRSRGV